MRRRRTDWEGVAIFVWIMFVLCIWALVAVVAVHFISKFW